MFVLDCLVMVCAVEKMIHKDKRG